MLLVVHGWFSVARHDASEFRENTGRGPCWVRPSAAGIVETELSVLDDGRSWEFRRPILGWLPLQERSDDGIRLKREMGAL